MNELTGLYDGTHLSITGMRGSPYVAISGKPGWQQARYQAGNAHGPIVEGKYTARIVIDSGGAQFKRRLDDDALTCKLEPSYSIQEIRVTKQHLDRKPGQTNLRIIDCADAAAAWGQYRWRLVPDAKTQQTIAGYKRSGGFHLHGGGTASLGTSGCIRVGDTFWSDLRALIERHAKTLRTLNLTVRYPSRETLTGPVGAR